MMMTVDIRGRLMDLDVPKVMGILNVTDDSFYAGCRALDEEPVVARVCQIRDEGADIIDIGACSSRPGALPVDAAVEMSRLAWAIDIVRRVWKEAVISVDTFRASVAGDAVRAGADIINDISGGADPDMFDTVAALRVPYILTHNSPGSGIPNPLCGSGSRPSSDGNPRSATAEILTWLAFKIRDLRSRGVCDIIVDPGFGFAKTLEENYRLMADLDEICRIGLPVLVGVSRKSMIYRPLGISPEDALPGTIALDTVAVMKGARILRVHDVAAAVQAVAVAALIPDHS